jgi:hypothetical protein
MNYRQKKLNWFKRFKTYKYADNNLKSSIKVHFLLMQISKKILSVYGF